jgi:uncharacterized protein (TIGR02300 family)
MVKDCNPVAKPELGVKRLCAHCGTKFYDLSRSPILCPKCGAVYEIIAPVTRGRPDAARVASREAEAELPETPEAEFVSLEEADAESQGKKKSTAEPIGPDEDVEIDDESLDDAAFIEEAEEEDTDVSGILGGDIENEEET